MQEKLINMVAEQFNVSPKEITLKTKIRADLGADSLDTFELVSDIEDEFGIKIDKESFYTMESVEDVLKYLNSHSA